MTYALSAPCQSCVSFWCKRSNTMLAFICLSVSGMERGFPLFFCIFLFLVARQFLTLMGSSTWGKIVSYKSMESFNSKSEVNSKGASKWTCWPYKNADTHLKQKKGTKKLSLYFFEVPFVVLRISAFDSMSLTWQMASEINSGKSNPMGMRQTWDFALPNGIRLPVKKRKFKADR